MLPGFARLSEALLHSHTALVCLIKGVLSAYLKCLVLNLEDILCHAFKVLLQESQLGSKELEVTR